MISINYFILLGVIFVVAVTREYIRYGKLEKENHDLTIILEMYKRRHGVLDVKDFLEIAEDLNK